MANARWRPNPKQYSNISFHLRDSRYTSKCSKPLKFFSRNVSLNCLETCSGLEIFVTRRILTKLTLHRQLMRLNGMLIFLKLLHVGRFEAGDESYKARHSHSNCFSYLPHLILLICACLILVDFCIIHINFEISRMCGLL